MMPLAGPTEKPHRIGRQAHRGVLRLLNFNLSSSVTVLPSQGYSGGHHDGDSGWQPEALPLTSKHPLTAKRHHHDDPRVASRPLAICHHLLTLRLSFAALLSLPFAALLTTLLIVPTVMISSPIASLICSLLPPPFPTFPLSSPPILTLLEADRTRHWDIARPSDPGPLHLLPWTGMLPLRQGSSAPFHPGAKYVYFRRGMDSCAGFIHYTASLRCRAHIAARLKRTLLVDADFCTAQEHAREGRGYMRPLHAYYDMDVVRV